MTNMRFLIDPKINSRYSVDIFVNPLCSKSNMMQIHELLDEKSDRLDVDKSE